MRILSVLAVCLGLLAAAPAVAQDAGSTRRLELAEQYIELSLGDSISSLVAGFVEEELAATPDMPERERAWMRPVRCGEVVRAGHPDRGVTGARPARLR